MLNNNLSIIILAAGKGTRMNNLETPKVLAQLLNKPLIDYVVSTAFSLFPNSVTIVVGYKKELVIDYINLLKYSDICYVEQKEQLGTGHAVLHARDLFDGNRIDVLILSGDVPLLTSTTLNEFIEHHKYENASLSVLSAIADNPFGYGRIVRDKENNFIQIVEEKDADDYIKQITEINSGIYLVSSDLLFKSLGKIENNNAQKEFYLTDIVDIIRLEGKKVLAIQAANFEEIQGINTIEQLIQVEKMLVENKNYEL